MKGRMNKLLTSRVLIHIPGLALAVLAIVLMDKMVAMGVSLEASLNSMFSVIELAATWVLESFPRYASTPLLAISVLVLLMAFVLYAFMAAVSMSKWLSVALLTGMDKLRMEQGREDMEMGPNTTNKTWKPAE